MASAYSAELIITMRCYGEPKATISDTSRLDQSLQFPCMYCNLASWVVHLQKMLHILHRDISWQLIKPLYPEKRVTCNLSLNSPLHVVQPPMIPPTWSNTNRCQGVYVCDVHAKVLIAVSLSFHIRHCFTFLQKGILPQLNGVVQTLRTIRLSDRNCQTLIF